MYYKKKHSVSEFVLLNLMLMFLFVFACEEIGPRFESIELNKSSTVLGINQTEQLYASMNLTNKGRKDQGECRVDWYSNNSSVVTVSEDGLIKGISSGTAIIMALSNHDDKSDQCTVTVIDTTISVLYVTIPKSIVIDPGRSERLIPQIFPNNATNQKLLWESSDTTITFVEQSGLLTGKKEGVSVITVKAPDGNTSAQCSVFVYWQVADVRLYHNPVLEPGQSIKIVPDVIPEKAKNQNVTWSVSNESVVSVTPAGLVTAKALGTSVLAVTTEEGFKTAQCHVTVVAKNTVVVKDIDGNTYSTVRIGDQLWTVENLRTKTLNDGTPIKPFVSNSEEPNYCLYNDNETFFSTYGLLYNKFAAGSGKLAPTGWRVPTQSDIEKMTVYLVRNGLTANGIAKNMGGLSNYTNNLAKPLASKTGWNSTATGSPIPALAPGNDLTTNNLTGFNALPGGYRASATEFKFFGDRALFWSTLAETFKITYGIFKISSHSPHVNLPQGGSHDNVHSSDDRYSDDFRSEAYSVRIMRDILFDEVKVSSITVSPSSLTVKKKSTTQLSHVIVPLVATNQMVTWSSSDTAVAIVASGIVIAKNAGTAKITVTTQDGNFSASSIITVPKEIIAVSGVFLNDTALSMQPHQTNMLRAFVIPEDAHNKEIFWSSSDTNVVNVSNGMITAKSVGSAVITVTTSDGANSAECIVTVSEAIIPVATVVLDKAKITLLPNQIDTLTAVVVPENATDKGVSWSSSDTNIISVNNGVITAKAIGSAVVTVTTKDGNKVANCKITVSSDIIPVATVVLDKAKITLLPNQIDTLTAVVVPENATDKGVSWSSSDTNIVSVNNGVITTKAIGSAVVTVTTKDGNKTASCEVAVPEIVVLVAGVVLSNTSFTLLPNQTDTLKAIVIPENATNKEISWNSSDTNVVTVNNGSITAKAVGTAQITVTTDDGSKVAHCVVNVSTDIVSVTGVLLSTSSISLFPNQTDTLKVNILPENASDKKVTWSSADTTIVSVIYGVIAAKRVGKTTVTVTTNDGNKTAEFTVTVVPPNVSVYSVTLNKSLSILFPHGEDTLKATILPWDATNKNLIWTSSHPSIVSVSDGVITAHDTGKVQVSVTTQDGNKIANCQVLVVIPVIEVSSVTLNKTTLSLDRNESEMLIATVLPENATNKSISWGTSDPEIVSVEEGVVTALNPGTARIIALSSNERTSAKCTVTVVEPTIPVTGVSIDRSELSMSVYTTYWLYANILPENATNRNISWKSSDESVVKVNDGKIIAINAGSATIAVTSEDGEHSATCLVSVEHDLGTVNDVEGNEYGTIRIGNLIWTTENIRTTRYNDNTEIALADNTTWSSDTEGAHHISDGRVYYNWHVINTGRLAPVEGGWRVPTIDDWEALAKTLVLFGYNYDGTTDTTQENKIASSLSAQSDWEPSDENPGAPGRDLSANNRSQFNALPDGFRHLNGTFIENNGQRTDWWSSSPAKSAIDALLAFLLNNSSKLNLGSMDKRNGFPVRLVKDALEH